MASIYVGSESVKKTKSTKPILPFDVIELFAGVGGFHLGLKPIKLNKSNAFQIAWSNQWEPGAKKQYASDIYVKRFGSDKHSNQDISDVKINDIPDADVLVGGFPCQDYSVARTLKQAAGLEGKKGVLWWQIHRILKEKGNKKPKYLILENVDRLLKSPAKQRGRDFAIMLASLSDLGYAVEWKVINAADFGFPQRRRRVFFIGYHQSTEIYRSFTDVHNITDWMNDHSVINSSFPGTPVCISNSFSLVGDLADISNSFGKNEDQKFLDTGFMIDREIFTAKTKSIYRGKAGLLKDILVDDTEVPKEFYINKKDIAKWKELKGPKKLERVSNGFKYYYSEGGMAFPDPISKPSRTIVTGEGGSTPSRFKHAVRTKKGLRRLTPVELELLNGFPKDHTNIPGISPVRRAFLMGNALVVGVVKGLGQGLINAIRKTK